MCYIHICMYNKPCHPGVFITYTGLWSCSLNWQWFNSPQSTTTDGSKNNNNKILNVIFDYSVVTWTGRFYPPCSLLFLGNLLSRLNGRSVCSDITGIWYYQSYIKKLSILDHIKVCILYVYVPYIIINEKKNKIE